jgi:hypothetical protein
MALEQEGPSEDALFDNAIDPAPAEPAPVERAVEKPAAEAADTSAAPEARERPPVDDDAPQVPHWRVREITEEKRAAIAERDALKAERDRFAYEQQEFRRRLQQLEAPAVQEQPAEPDPLLDPKGFRDFVRKDVEERLLNERRENSLQVAKRTYKEEFDQAYQVARNHVDPALRARMQQSNDPGETLMGWFRELKMRAEVGNDLTAYRQKLRDEALKDPEFRKTAMEAWQAEAPAHDASGRPNVRLAPSLNGISRSNAQLRSSLQADMPDEALWDNVTTGRRK